MPACHSQHEQGGSRSRPIPQGQGLVEELDDDSDDDILLDD